MAPRMVYLWGWGQRGHDEYQIFQGTQLNAVRIKDFMSCTKKAIKFIIELHCMKSARNKYHTPSIAPESPCYRPGDSVPSAAVIHPSRGLGRPLSCWLSVPLPPCNARATWPLLVGRRCFAALRWLQRGGHQTVCTRPAPSGLVGPVRGSEPQSKRLVWPKGVTHLAGHRGSGWGHR